MVPEANKVQVTEYPRFSTWLGGSILASLAKIMISVLKFQNQFLFCFKHNFDKWNCLTNSENNKFTAFLSFSFHTVKAFQIRSIVDLFLLIHNLAFPQNHSRIKNNSLFCSLFLAQSFNKANVVCEIKSFARQTIVCATGMIKRIDRDALDLKGVCGHKKQLLFVTVPSILSFYNRLFSRENVQPPWRCEKFHRCKSSNNAHFSFHNLP